jgi:hypothetical protein
MAPARLRAVLEVEVSAPWAPAPDRPDRRADRADGEREPALEPAAHRERAKLGHAVSKDTVAKYMPKPPERPPRPPSQTWKTFLRNDLAGTIAVDFLTVPTVTFGILYVFVVLSLERRRVLHVNVTRQPHAAWAAQQIVEAIGDARPPVSSGIATGSTAPSSTPASATPASSS